MSLMGINSTMGHSFHTSSNRHSRSSVVVDSTDCVNRGSMHMLYNLNGFLMTHLTGLLFNDRVTILTGDISTLLNRHLDWHLLWNEDTVSDRLVNTINLGYLFVYGDTLLNWLGLACGLGHWSVDCIALCYSLLDTVGFWDLSGHNTALLSWYLNTNRNSCTPRHSNGTGNLDGNLTALTLSNSSAVGRTSRNTTDNWSSRDGCSSQRNSRSKSTNKRTVSKKELRISLGVSFSISFTLYKSIP